MYFFYSKTQQNTNTRTYLTIYTHQTNKKQNPYNLSTINKFDHNYSQTPRESHPQTPSHNNIHTHTQRTPHSAILEHIPTPSFEASSGRTAPFRATHYALGRTRLRPRLPGPDLFARGYISARNENEGDLCNGRHKKRPFARNGHHCALVFGNKSSRRCARCLLSRSYT